MFRKNISAGFRHSTQESTLFSSFKHFNPRSGFTCNQGKNPWTDVNKKTAQEFSNYLDTNKEIKIFSKDERSHFVDLGGNDKENEASCERLRNEAHLNIAYASHLGRAILFGELEEVYDSLMGTYGKEMELSI